ncbi:MAG: NADP-dependent oxidoreductase [Parahaliea sp.]
MPEAMNQVLVVARLPKAGPLDAGVFDVVEETLPALADGETLVEAIYLSIDAGSRAQLDPDSDYVYKVQPGDRLACSGVVARVVESRDPGWQAGDLVVTNRAQCARYQKLQALPGNPIRRIESRGEPLAAHLGIFGMVGFTAYIGMLEIARPTPGDTVLVSAAAGATGSIAGQFAKIAGSRVVGIAGGAKKCKLVVEEFGFDDCIDYKAGDIRQMIATACPDGVDVYYENVGGEIQKAAFEAMNDFGRVAMCGQIGQYSGGGAEPGPNLMGVVLKRLKVQGFLCRDHESRYDEFLENAVNWYLEGRLKHHATVTEGIGNFYEAINSLTSGRNIGKQLCQVGSLLSSQ